MVTLWRRPALGWLLASRPVVVAVPLVIVAALFTLLLGGGSALFVGVLVTVLLLTAVVLVALLVAWALGRSVEEVGVLLPVYLVGAALFCYPTLLLLVEIGQGGLAC
jgi:hypothetical protein